jgi:hypothetical protein
MKHERQIRRVLIYKRTHEGDPDPRRGVFGNGECMKRVRSREFNAVIGVGGIRPLPKYKGIARKLTWIGIGAHKNKIGTDGYPLVTFDHFWYEGEDGDLLKKRAPMLARHIYDGKVRVLMVDSSSAEWGEVKEILYLARDAPPSVQLGSAFQRNSQKTGSKCRPNSYRGKSAADAKEHCG